MSIGGVRSLYELIMCSIGHIHSWLSYWLIEKLQSLRLASVGSVASNCLISSKCFSFPYVQITHLASRCLEGAFRRELLTKILPLPSLKTRIEASSELMVGAVHLPPGRVYFRAEFVYLSLVFIAPLLDISDLKIFTNANFLDINAAP